RAVSGRSWSRPSPAAPVCCDDVKALTLFVTHYPPLCELERVYPEHVSNFHMAFLLNEPDINTDADRRRGPARVHHFPLQLTEGAAGRSYGLNVARLVDIPVPILHTAARKAESWKNTVNARRRAHVSGATLWCAMLPLSRAPL
ncbi:hypothetical protein KUCAC02_029242, partial [Chaenocephalus aceratus]